jgi:hypothetical protein
MDRATVRAELERLVEEAPRIAPSIRRITADGNYGAVTDENLDRPSFLRWKVETEAILHEMAVADGGAFEGLHAEYLLLKEKAKKFHSSSILVHKTLEMLGGALQLLGAGIVREKRHESALDPWPVIRGLLLRLSSYQVPEIVDRTGLVIDWDLTERQNHSHSTRLNAYRPRIDSSYQALSRDDRLRVAYILVKELAAVGLASALAEGLRPIGWDVHNGRLVAGGAPARELFFSDQTQHSAYVEIRRILTSATSSITLVDPFVDQSILTLFSAVTGEGIAIRILSSNLPRDFQLEAGKWLAQHKGLKLEVRTTKQFHDRFIVLNDEQCWHVGCSIKDAGNKAFMLSQVEDPDNRAALLTQIARSWSAASDIII